MSSRATALLTVAGAAVVLGACGASPGPGPTATATATATETQTEGVSAGAGVPLDRAAGEFVRFDEAQNLAVVDACTTSTSSRSTVIVDTDDGGQVALTLFTSEDPALEIDVDTADGRSLLNTDIGRQGRWEFQGSLLVGEGDVMESVAAPGRMIAFAIDFSADLPQCDDQDELGPGDDRDATSTPDVTET